MLPLVMYRVGLFRDQIPRGLKSISKSFKECSKEDFRELQGISQGLKSISGTFQDAS